MITASIPTLKGGSVNKTTLMKGARIAEIAWQCGLPSINLNESVRVRCYEDARKSSFY